MSATLKTHIAHCGAAESATLEPASPARPVSSRGASLRIGVAILCVLGLLLGGLASNASAKTKSNKPRGVYLLGQAKAALQVGEKPDGYLGLVDESASDQIKKMVKDTNERRKARYLEAAKKRGSTLERMEALAGEKLAKNAKPGELLMTADGKWEKK